MIPIAPLMMLTMMYRFCSKASFKAPIPPYSLCLSFNKDSQFPMLHDEDISMLLGRRVDKFIFRTRGVLRYKDKASKSDPNTIVINLHGNSKTRSFRWLYS
jgi:hypothetical protein